MLETGLTDVQSERVNVAFESASAEEYNRYSQATSPSARIALSKETEKKTYGERWQKKQSGIMELLMAT